MDLSSNLALRVYEQIFWGIDKPLGYTLDEDESGARKPVSVPADIPWYASHPDPRMPAWFLKELVAEISAKGIPGLSLAGCQQLDDEAFAHLQAAPRLEILDLFNTRITDAGVAFLGKLTALGSLNLAGTAITDRAIEVIAGLPALETLHLGWTELSDASLARLASAPSLKTLDLRGTRITDAGLARLTGLKSLRALSLQETGAGDAGVAALAPLAPVLERLYLGYTRVTDACVNTLTTFTRLRTLSLRGTVISAEQEKRLAAALTGLGGVGTGPQGIQEGLIR